MIWYELSTECAEAGLGVEGNGMCCYFVEQPGCTRRRRQSSRFFPGHLYQKTSSPVSGERSNAPPGTSGSTGLGSMEQMVDSACRRQELGCVGGAPDPIAGATRATWSSGNVSMGEGLLLERPDRPPGHLSAAW